MQATKKIRKRKYNSQRAGKPEEIKAIAVENFGVGAVEQSLKRRGIKGNDPRLHSVAVSRP